MGDEFETFKRTIQCINSEQFSPAYSLVGKIVGYTPNMQYCDVEVDMRGGRHTFSKIPAHGYPVVGSTGIIHFHNGNLEQPVCDCAYRLNPPEETLREEVTDSCWNWLDNGNFMFKWEGYTKGPTSDSVELIEDGYTSDFPSCVLKEYGSYIEKEVDVSRCNTKYFKFQFVYRGNGILQVECFNADTGDAIITQPEDIGHEYKLWTSPFGRFKWSYNKEVYKHVNDDGTKNDKIKVRITNVSSTEDRINDGETVNTQIPMNVDALLVFSENGGTKFYNSETDMLKFHDLVV